MDMKITKIVFPILFLLLQIKTCNAFVLTSFDYFSKMSIFSGRKVSHLILFFTARATKLVLLRNEIWIFSRISFDVQKKDHQRQKTNFLLLWSFKNKREKAAACLQWNLLHYSPLLLFSSLGSIWENVTGCWRIVSLFLLL